MESKTSESVPASRGILPKIAALAVLVTALAALLLLAAPGVAQETGNAAPRAGDGDARTTAPNAASDQYGDSTGQQASNTAQAQATDPLAGEPAQITDSPDDTDNTVDQIVVAVAGCTVDADATVTVKDADGTRVELTNGQNVNITADANQIAIEGSEPDGNLGGISPNDGNGNFDPGTGEVVSSTGITCGATSDTPSGQGSGTLVGEAAEIRESADDTDDIVDRILIDAADCTVDEDASITVADDDGTQVELTNGDNVNITAGDDQITIVGTGTGGNLEGINSAGQFGTEGQTVTGEVISVTGITCGAGDVDDDDDVVPGTTPKKDLANTGGMPLALGMFALGLALVGAGSLLRAALGRER